MGILKKERNLVILFFPKTEKNNVNRNIPLSLLKIGSELKGEGYDVLIIDERFEEKYENSLSNALDGAICFCASVMTGYQILGGLKASHFVRKIAGNIPVVWGGWHPSLLPAETLKNDFVDVVVRGQGEPAICELVRALKEKTQLKHIEGISYKENGAIFSNKCRELYDVNNFHPVRFDILKLERYISKNQLGQRSIFWNSSQGCPYGCGFCCTAAVFKRRWSGLRFEKLIEEVKILVDNFRVDSITFAEDNFFVDLKRVEDFCYGLLKTNLNIRWATDIRIDKLNQLSDAFMRLLKASGCVKLYIGAESGDQEILDLIDKRIRLEETYRAAEKLHKYKIICDFFVVVGFPVNPKKDLMQSLKMINEIKSLYPDHQFTPLIFTPYPGIPLLGLSVKHGLKIPQKLEEWSNWSVLSITTPWLNKRYLDTVNMYTKYLYPSAFPSTALKIKLKKKLIGFPYKVFHKLSHFRINNNFFILTIEWRMLKIFYRLRAKFKFLKGVDSFR